jgi:hypothetical protein
MSLLTAFLVKQVPGIEEIVYWDDLRLHVTSYLTAETPPLAFVTSVRAVHMTKDNIKRIYQQFGCDARFAEMVAYPAHAAG